jgi:hypothetical protein
MILDRLAIGRLGPRVHIAQRLDSVFQPGQSLDRERKVDLAYQLLGQEDLRTVDACARVSDSECAESHSPRDMLSRRRRSWKWKQRVSGMLPLRLMTTQRPKHPHPRP